MLFNQSLNQLQLKLQNSGIFIQKKYRSTDSNFFILSFPIPMHYEMANECVWADGFFFSTQSVNIFVWYAMRFRFTCHSFISIRLISSCINLLRFIQFKQTIGPLNSQSFITILSKPQLTNYTKIMLIIDNNGEQHRYRSSSIISWINTSFPSIQNLQIHDPGQAQTCESVLTKTYLMKCYTNFEIAA